MAHHVYQTEGYVLGTSPFGESGAFIRIYTKDLGLVHATAQGIRLQKSKLKYSLQDYSFAHISLVRGKEIWRITNARPEHNLFFALRNKPESATAAARILSLLERLVRGEESHVELFSTIHCAFTFLLDNDLSSDQIRRFEHIVVLTMLHHLGYGTESVNLSRFTTMPISLAAIEEMASLEREAAAFIRSSLAESQL